MKNLAIFDNRNKIICLLVALFTTGVITHFSPITQTQSYHHFAEQRMIWDIPHIGDVLSNIAFFIAGLVLLITNNKKTELYPGQKNIFYFFVFAVMSLCFGSGYYHWNPNNQTLVWDRATMILGFAVIFYDSLIRYNVVTSRYLYIRFDIVIFVFLATLVCWRVTGRLEPYVFVQFFTMFALIVLAFINKKNIYSSHLIWMLGWYTIAKMFELNDKQVFHLTHEIISGHTLKHLAYAIALYAFGKGMLKSE